MVRKRFAAIAALLTSTAFSQPASAPLAFEVVSIKPSAGNGPFGMEPLPGKFRATNMPIRILVELAYGTQDYQMSGMLDWMANEKYDIVAEAGRIITNDERRLMIQSMLADRFRLAIHKETREMQVYALVAPKNGPKLRPTDKTEGRSGVLWNAGRITGTRATVPQLVDMLSRVFGRPVLDKTGLEGQYDFTLEYEFPLRASVEDPGARAQPTAPSIFTALQEQLGLKLESQKGTGDVYVIDHVERPSAN